MAVVDITALIEPEETSFCVPVEAMKAAAALFSQQKRKKPKDRKTISIRKTETAVVVSVDKSSRSQSFDIETTQFPKWDGACPASGGYTLGISLSVDILQRLLASLNGDRKLGSEVAELYISAPDKPIILAAMNRDRKNFGVLMPVRAGIGMPKRFWIKD
jgi:hypothetical protein